MSSFAGSFIVAAFVTGKYLLNYIDRMNGTFIGGFLIIVNLLGIGSLGFLDDNDLIIRLSFMFQIIGGMGNGINSPSTLAVLSSYKEKRESYIAINQAVAGLGALVGPMLGALLYAFGGYEAPFYGIGGCYLSMVIYFLCNLKKNQES